MTGTGCFLLYNVGTKPVISKHGLLATVAFDFPGRDPVYALEGSIAVAGSGVKFLMQNLGFGHQSEKISELAESVDDNGGLHFVTAFSGLFAPYWIDDAQGTMCMYPVLDNSNNFTHHVPFSPTSISFHCLLSFSPTIAYDTSQSQTKNTDQDPLTVGITQHTQRGHIARATLEAVCFQTAAILNAMSADSGHKLTELKVDGGMSNSKLCMQTQADLVQIPIIRPKMRETTALGAAIAAGFASGVWKDFDELKEVNTKGETRFEAEIGKEVADKRFKRWEKAVQMTRGWVENEEAVLKED